MSDVDRDSAARHALCQLAGTRKTIDIAALPATLHLVAAPPERLGRGSFSATDQRLTLAIADDIVVGQGRIRVAVVHSYLDQLAAGQPIAEIIVTDRPRDGRCWHLDGLHRTLAARLRAEPILARIWR